VCMGYLEGGAKGECGKMTVGQKPGKMAALKPVDHGSNAVGSKSNAV
jgi:hypothetical protein